MKLRLVMSGGQTGGDRTALEEAKAIGIETGGWAPRGYRTEDGPDPTLKDFGLKETASSDYPTRTRWNVRDSEATLWFGSTKSRGYACTAQACTDFGRTIYINPTPDQLRTIIDVYEVVNWAGNRKSRNPEVVDLVRNAFKVIKEAR